MSEYWIDVFDKISIISAIIMGVSGVFIIVVSVSAAIVFTSKDEEWKSSMRFSLILGIIFIISLLVFIFIP